MISSLNSIGQNAGIRLNIQAHGADLSDIETFIDNTSTSFKANSKGQLSIDGLEEGEHTLSIFLEGYRSLTLKVKAENPPVLLHEVALERLDIELDAVEVEEVSRSAVGLSRLKFIEVDGIYAAKKNEVVLPDEMPINRSSNNGRQTFGKVPGITVQETDAGGLQLGVGGRGLDPKRTTNFNTRQDGYDISADALGYPESYYTPPLEAVERIELVRGAASLQYGTQFGGLLNFKMKRGAKDDPIEITARQTIGSYNFLNTFASVGGEAGSWNYYGYYQHKEGSGWRPNSHFISNAGYVQVGKELNASWSVDLALTHSYYNAKQPGGLTDRQFEEDPSVSFRDRNWFQVNWNVAALTINGKLSENLTLNSKTFLVHSSRAALGFLGNINRVDTGGARELILGEFNNLGNETRLIRRFNINSNPGAVLIGARFYRGDTRNRQGKAPDGDGPNYSFLNPDDLEGSDVDFPSQNVSVFTEALVPLSACWFITPGARFEYISTSGNGYYTETSRHPLTNELLSRERIEESYTRNRRIVLFGIGALWKCRPDLEFYANASQNYRAINFSDIYVNNPNLLVNPDMEDERGFTVDLGTKGSLYDGLLNFDAGVFLMQYRNRIGLMLRSVETESGVQRVVNVRDNISDAFFMGVEAFEELNLSKLFVHDPAINLTWFNNIALIEAQYISSEVSAFDGNRVENVPELNYRTGLGISGDHFSGGVQYSFISEQYTDATNATFFPDATVGLIPAYSVLDLTCSYSWNRFKLEGSVNNLTDEVYFTRRATGYPGPGIIPAERRMYFLTLEVVL